MRALFTILLILLSVSACNTMQGLGRDIEALGSGLDRTAGDAKDNM